MVLTKVGRHVRLGDYEYFREKLETLNSLNLELDQIRTVRQTCVLVMAKQCIPQPFFNHYSVGIF